jgi:hypothetical protein
MRSTRLDLSNPQPTIKRRNVMTKNNWWGIRTIAILIVALIVSVLPFEVVKTASAEPSEQVIFSGIGFADTGDWQSPVGFWIWCQDEGNGPYAGRCAGAMYVYAQGITVHVEGTVTEEADDTYTMNVTSEKPGVLEATLHNLSEDSGPNNTVEFTVTTAEGTSSGDSGNAVVLVTGPGD